MSERLHVAAYILTEAAQEPDPYHLPIRVAHALRIGMRAEGAAVTLMPHTATAQLLCASDDVVLRLEELQFEVGRGPGMACAAIGQPVVVADSRQVHPQWPVYSTLVGEQLPQVRALWAFPVVRGYEVLGSVLLYRTCRWPARPGEVEQGRLAARAVARLLEDMDSTMLAENGGRLWEPREVVESHWGSAHRAAGALGEHLGLPVSDALLLMRARALSTNTPLPQLAASITRNPASWDNH
ncbi:GAF domain-containing protein [Streptomyces sp. NPDC004111]|uniref:GAF domain-containing protein n=1 Tax=Streptomyces sp. NPDC004111 TaxID=3364690 RepID=UPI00368798BD